MPQQSNEILLRIKADDDASAVIKKLTKELQKLGAAGGATAPKFGGDKGLGGAFGKLTGLLGGLGIALPGVGTAIAGVGLAVTAGATAVFKAAKSFETYQQQLKSAEGSAEAADKRLKELVETGKEIAGLDLKGLIKFNNQLKVAKLNSAETDTVMESVSKAMVEVGSSSADTARVLTQVTQAFAGNRLEAQDLKTLFSEVGKATTAMQNIFGETVTSVSDFRDISESLGLSAKESLLLVFEELDRITKVDTNTTAAQWEILQETWSQTAAIIGKGLNIAVRELLKGINWLTEATGEFFGKVFGSKGFQVFSAVLSTIAKIVFDIVKGPFIAFFKIITKIVGLFLKFNPWVLLIRGVIALVNKLVKALGGWSAVFDAIQKGAKIAFNFILDAITAIARAIDKIPFIDIDVPIEGYGKVIEAAAKAKEEEVRLAQEKAAEVKRNEEALKSERERLRKGISDYIKEQAKAGSDAEQLANAKTLADVKDVYDQRRENAQKLHDMKLGLIKNETQFELNQLKQQLVANQEATAQKIADIRENVDNEQKAQEEIDKIRKEGAEEDKRIRGEITKVAAKGQKDITALNQEGAKNREKIGKDEAETNKKLLEGFVTNAAVEYDKLLKSGTATSDELRKKEESRYEAEKALIVKTIKDKNEQYWALQKAAEGHNKIIGAIAEKEYKLESSKYERILDSGEGTYKELETASLSLLDATIKRNNETLKDDNDLRLANEEAEQEHVDRMNEIRDESNQKQRKAATEFWQGRVNEALLNLENLQRDENATASQLIAAQHNVFEQQKMLNRARNGDTQRARNEETNIEREHLKAVEQLTEKAATNNEKIVEDSQKKTEKRLDEARDKEVARLKTVEIEATAHYKRLQKQEGVTQNELEKARDAAFDAQKDRINKQFEGETTLTTELAKLSTNRTNAQIEDEERVADATGKSLKDQQDAIDDANRTRINLAKQTANEILITDEASAKKRAIAEQTLRDIKIRAANESALNYLEKQVLINKANEEFEQAIKDIKAELKDLGKESESTLGIIANGVEGLVNNVSSTFANMLLDWKFDWKELGQTAIDELKNIAKAVIMGKIFEPIATGFSDAIMGGIGQGAQGAAGSLGGATSIFGKLGVSLGGIIGPALALAPAVASLGLVVAAATGMISDAAELGQRTRLGQVVGSGATAPSSPFSRGTGSQRTPISSGAGSRGEYGQFLQARRESQALAREEREEAERYNEVLEALGDTSVDLKKKLNESATAAIALGKAFKDDLQGHELDNIIAGADTLDMSVNDAAASALVLQQNVDNLADSIRGKDLTGREGFLEDFINSAIAAGADVSELVEIWNEFRASAAEPVKIKVDPVIIRDGVEYPYDPQFTETATSQLGRDIRGADVLTEQPLFGGGFVFENWDKVLTSLAGLEMSEGQLDQQIGFLQTISTTLQSGLALADDSELKQFFPILTSLAETFKKLGLDIPQWILDMSAALGDNTDAEIDNTVATRANTKAQGTEAGARAAGAIGRFTSGAIANPNYFSSPDDFVLSNLPDLQYQQEILRNTPRADLAGILPGVFASLAEVGQSGLNTAEFEAFKVVLNEVVRLAKELGLEIPVWVKTLKLFHDTEPTETIKQVGEATEETTEKIVTWQEKLEPLKTEYEILKKIGTTSQADLLESADNYFKERLALASESGEDIRVINQEWTDAVLAINNNAHSEEIASTKLTWDILKGVIGSSQEEIADAINDHYDERIAEAKTNGRDTVLIEQDRNKALLANDDDFHKQRLGQTQQAWDILKVTDGASQEEIAAAINAHYAELISQAEALGQDTTILNHQKNQALLANDDKFHKDRLAQTQQAWDILKVTDGASQEEIANAIRAHYGELIAQAEKLGQDTTLLRYQQGQALLANENAFHNEEIAAAKLKWDILKGTDGASQDELKAAATDYYNELIEQAEANGKDTILLRQALGNALSNIDNNFQNSRINEAKYAWDVLKALGTASQEELLEAATNYYDELIALAELNSQDTQLIEANKNNALKKIREDGEQETTSGSGSIEESFSRSTSSSTSTPSRNTYFQREIEENEHKWNVLKGIATSSQEELIAAANRYYNSLIDDAKANSEDTVLIEQQRVKALEQIDDDFHRQRLAKTQETWDILKITEGASQEEIANAINAHYDELISRAEELGQDTTLLRHQQSQALLSNINDFHNEEITATKLHWDILKGIESTSQADLLAASDAYYDEEIEKARENGEDITLLEQAKVDSREDINNGFYDRDIAAAKLHWDILKGTTNASQAELIEAAIAYYDELIEKARKKGEDTTLLEQEEASAILAIRIKGYNDQLALLELNHNQISKVEGASATERIASWNEIFNLRKKILDESNLSEVEYALGLQQLTIENTENIEGIWRDHYDRIVRDRQWAFDRISEAEDASTQDRIDAAKELFEANKEFIRETINDEKERTRQLEQLNSDHARRVKGIWRDHWQEIVDSARHSYDVLIDDQNSSLDARLDAWRRYNQQRVNMADRFIANEEQRQREIYRINKENADGIARLWDKHYNDLATLAQAKYRQINRDEDASLEDRLKAYADYIRNRKASIEQSDRSDILKEAERINLEGEIQDEQRRIMSDFSSRISDEHRRDLESYFADQVGDNRGDRRQALREEVEWATQNLERVKNDHSASLKERLEAEAIYYATLQFRAEQLVDNTYGRSKRIAQIEKDKQKALDAIISAEFDKYLEIEDNKVIKKSESNQAIIANEQATSGTIKAIDQELVNTKNTIEDEGVEKNRESNELKLEDNDLFRSDDLSAINAYHDNVTEATSVFLEDLQSQYTDFYRSKFQAEGFLGAVTQARLENNLEDYRTYFTAVNDLARASFDYQNQLINDLNSRSFSPRGARRSSSRRVLSSGNRRLFHDPHRDYFAYQAGETTAEKMIKDENAKDFSREFGAGFFSQGFSQQLREQDRQKTQNINITIKADYGDGHVKEIANNMVQLERDNRVYRDTN